MVADVSGEEGHAPFEEHGRDDVDVRQMAATGQIGIVRDERITIVHRRQRVLIEHGAHRAVERPEMQRDLCPLRDQAPGGIEQRDGAVLALLDVGRK